MKDVTFIRINIISEMVYLKHILILSCSLISLSSVAQIYCSAEETFNGPVVSVNETKYELPEINGVISHQYADQDTIRLTEKVFIKVEGGMIVEKQILWATGSQKCRCTNKYSSDGQNIEETTLRSNDQVDTRIVKTWKNDQLIQIDRFNTNDSLYSSTVYIRNKHENIEVSKELVGGYEDNIIYTELNKDNLPLKRYTIDSLENKELFAEFQYDSLGRIIETHVWSYDGRYDQHFLIYYDSANRVVKRDWFNREGMFIGADSIVYSSGSNIIFERSYDFINGIWLNNTYKYKFDQYGNIVMKETWSGYLDRKKLKSRIIRDYIYEKQ